MFTRDIRLFEDSLNLFEATLGLIIYGIGLAIFAILLISAIQNYNTNRAYSVGAIVILCWYTLPPFLGALFSFGEIDLIEMAHMFFAFFGSIMSIALVFYVFMSCIRMLFERVR
jgi:hypothetical protein